MKKSILLSIKPKFVEKIKSGDKIFEYRRVVPKDCYHLYIYSSSPIKKVVGEADFTILTKDVESLWESTKDKSGITKEFFDEYYHDMAIGQCLKLSNISFYDKPKTLEDFNINYAPQNYIYLWKN